MPAENAIEDVAPFAACEAETALTDADIVAIVRSMAGSSESAERIDAIVLVADCMLGKGHDSPCACPVANARDGFGAPATAWLRWSETARSVDWLANCVIYGCPLFRGHAGDCWPPRGGES